MAVETEPAAKVAKLCAARSPRIELAEPLEVLGHLLGATRRRGRYLFFASLRDDDLAEHELLFSSASAGGAMEDESLLWLKRTARPGDRLRVVAHAAPVRSLLVHDDALWSGSTDGTVRCWDLPQLAAGDERWG